MAWPGPWVLWVSWVSRSQVPFSFAQNTQPWAAVPFGAQAWMRLPSFAWLALTSAALPLPATSVRTCPFCGCVVMSCRLPVVSLT